jgi:hypothetical protein
MTAQKAYDEASNVGAVDGEVTVDGPDGVGVSLTPEAAAETARRLLDAAAAAQVQSPAKGEETGS